MLIPLSYGQIVKYAVRGTPNEMRYAVRVAVPLRIIFKLTMLSTNVFFGNFENSSTHLTQPTTYLTYAEIRLPRTAYANSKSSRNGTATRTAYLISFAVCCVPRTAYRVLYYSPRKRRKRERTEKTIKYTRKIEVDRSGTAEKYGNYRSTARYDC